MSLRLGRRHFLRGLGGSFIAAPLLSSLIARPALAAVAPKRLIVLRHNHGRFIGNGLTNNGTKQDLWSPLTTSGALPAAMSPLLAPLAAIRNEVVTIDRVDNLVRHLATGTNANDGHHFPALTAATAMRPKADGTSGGPSIDFVVGQRIRSGASMPASIIINANSGNCSGDSVFWGANGTAPNRLNPCGSPREAITKLFAGVNPTTPVPPTMMPTLRDRLTASRSSILEGVAEDYVTVKNRLSTVDRARLDQHLDFLSDAQARFVVSTQPPPMPAAGCAPIAASAVPQRAEDYSYSAANDNLSVPVLTDAMVQALVCDVTRSLVFDFASDVPTFDYLYPNGTPFTSDVWHAQIHGSGSVNGAPVANVKPTYTYYSEVFTSLVQKLAAVTDVDGKRLLDNTLVLWISDLGYGASHGCFDYPVVLAGMKGAFTQGQGRHVVPSGRLSLGDVYAQVLRLFGGTDTTFGATGTLASLAGARTLSCDGGTSFCADYGFPGFVTPDTPLHSGTLTL